LSEGSEHVIHLHVNGHDWLINTGRLSQWHSLTEPYLQSQGVNRLDELVLCDAPAHEVEVLEQVKNALEVDKIARLYRQQVQDEIPRFRAVQCDPSAAASASPRLVEILFSNQRGSSEAPLGDLTLGAILVHLGKFRVLILPDVTEENIVALKCDHADVVYCGRLGGRRFPRNLMNVKLSPSILVLNGTKPEVVANPRDGSSGPKCLYVKRDGAVTTALQGDDLVVRGYRGTEVRLRSLTR
jgi:hypothetical protein